MVENEQETVERPFGMDELKRMHQNPWQALGGKSDGISDDRGLLYVCYGALLVQPPSDGNKILLKILAEHLKR